MATKKERRIKVHADPEGTKVVLDDIIQAVAVYERCRYGTVAHDDAVLPAAHAAASLRVKYERHSTEPDWGSILLSVAVSARRSGVSIPMLIEAVKASAEEWVRIGMAPAPGLPDSVPGTHPGSLLE